VAREQIAFPESSNESGDPAFFTAMETGNVSFPRLITSQHATAMHRLRISSAAKPLYFPLGIRPDSTPAQFVAIVNAAIAKRTS
jgi:hypothetical protein